ncbi:MAG TPA: histidine--tRNA ligase [Thermoanaerobaculia bacterium]|nr:histidine--tRNA ligase [Thermoanaerobaculia bacterium]
MTPQYRAVKGTRDLFPPETERWAAAESVCREVFRAHGFGPIRTPILEHTELFTRSVGETTDIVYKEMYTFPDRRGRSLTLRPENTAGVARAVIEKGIATGPMPLRLYYVGPQFRYERPQAGRYREFGQIGAELFGVAGPAGEAELLEMLFAFLKALGFVNLSVSINSVGTAATRSAFSEALRRHLAAHAAAFSEEDRRRLSENPLRLFESKDPSVRALLSDAPTPRDFLDEESGRHHEEVLRLLGEAGIPCEENPSLVRGLDYYTRTVFEVLSKELGAQDAILGGGRYDNLVESLGGPALPAVGFAIGEDRLLQVAPFRPPAAGWVLVLPQGPEELSEALRVAAEVRLAAPGSSVEVDLLARGFRKGLSRAGLIYDEAVARGYDRERMFVVLLGADEKAAGTVTWKNLATGEQETFPRWELSRRVGAGRQA